MRKKQRFIAWILVILLASSTLGYAISDVIKTNYYSQDESEESIQDLEDAVAYSEKLQIALNNAITEKKFVKNSSVDDLLKRNNAGDYSLSSALNILGTPVCVLESIDSYAITCYDESKEITSFLASIETNTKYTNNSFIQMYWMKENGEAIISWVALGEDDMSEVKIIGIISSQFQELESLDIKVANNTEKIFNDLGLTKDEMLNKYNPYPYRTQYKLLNCNFVRNMMTGNEYDSVWYEYLLKNDYGYLHLNVENDLFYLVYQDFNDVKDIPAYDENIRNQLKSNMTISEFLEIMPEAIMYENYVHNSGSTFTCYIIRVDEETENVIYYDFQDGKLILELDNSKSEENIESSIEELESEQNN